MIKQGDKVRNRETGDVLTCIDVWDDGVDTRITVAVDGQGAEPVFTIDWPAGQCELKSNNNEHPHGFVEWLANGRRGSSSNAIATKLTGVNCCSIYNSVKDYPRDSSDFGRCHKLLKAVPEFRERLQEMASVSPIWAALVNEWDALEATFEMEISSHPDRHAPKTLQMLRDIFASVGVA